MIGGKIIASGTYGCILSPALPCAGEIKRPENTVSKLMRKSDAVDEINEITSIKKRTTKIPNHNDYFILNQIKMCPPSKLTSEDTRYFDSRCTALTRHGTIKRYNVNEDAILNGLRVLQLPDGGFDITHYWHNSQISSKLFIKMNTQMVDLLLNGVSKLNSVGVLHQDLKGANIVYSTNAKLARVIDWGLSTVINGKRVPESVRGCPVIYNQPLCNIVFHNYIQDIYNNAMKSRKIKEIISMYYGSDLISYLEPIIRNMFMNLFFVDKHSINNYIGSIGHIHYLEKMLEKIPNAVLHSPFRSVSKLVSSHLAKVFLTYSIKDNKVGPFREKEFFNNAYRHNCDIIGFLSSYVDLIMNPRTPDTIVARIIEIMNKYYFDPNYAVVKIDVLELGKELMELNKIMNPAAGVTPIPEIVVEREKDVLTWSQAKRCPRGMRRDKKTMKCIKKELTKAAPHATKAAPHATKAAPHAKTRRKRCPNGTRRNKKTKDCDPINK
jgi:serine/threonine protein kinase